MCFPLPWADAAGAARTRTASATTVERAPSASLGRTSSLLGAGGKTDHADATPPAAARSTAARRRYDGTTHAAPSPWWNRGADAVARRAHRTGRLRPARRRPGAGALPDRDQRAGPRDVLEPGLAAARAGQDAVSRGVGLGEDGAAGRGRRLHAGGARRRTGRARDVHRASRLLQRAPLRPRALLPRPERARLPRRVPPVRRPLPVGAHVRRLERGQPHLPTDVRPAAARRALLPRAAQRAPPARLPGPRRRRARHREPAPVPARVPAARPRTSAALGAAQLPGREPGHGRRHAPDAAPRSAARCG